MPKQVQARAAQDTQEERLVRKAAAGFLLSLVIGAPMGTVAASLLSWRVSYHFPQV